LQAVGRRAARRGEFAVNQQISADVVELMKEAGVYRACVAKRFGGDEASPADFLRLIEKISIADGSAGWVASFGVSGMYLASLPLDTLAQMYADGPDVVFSGMIFPPQNAVPVAGGLEVSGRWSWGSGSTGADYIGVGIKVEDGGDTGGLPLVAVMPADKTRIVRNWDVIGLKGTGSHDVVVDKVVVPANGRSCAGRSPISTVPCSAIRRWRWLRRSSRSWRWVSAAPRSTN
jgi:alkylation response protein AidB-like acyl-CoA dehydrogenase